MKWHNKDNTVGVDTTKIAFWTYKDNVLQLYFGHSEPFAFHGEEAKEIYKILTETKEVI